jgi:hypothetical protein
LSDGKRICPRLQYHSDEPQALFGELAKLIRNRARHSQRNRPIPNRLPSEAIADCVDGAVGYPTRCALLGTGTAHLIFEPDSSCTIGFFSKFDTEIPTSEMIFSLV